MRRIRAPLNRHALFEECVSEVSDRYGQHFRLLFLGSKQNKIDEAFGYVRGYGNNIYRLLQSLDVLLNQIIDLAVQAALRCTLVLRHDLPFAHHVSLLLRPAYSDHLIGIEQNL
jgi:hypothetical protein